MIAIMKLLQARRQLWTNYMTKTSNSPVHAEWGIVYIVFFFINDSILDKFIYIYTYEIVERNVAVRSNPFVS